MASTTTNLIDTGFPVAGVDNDSQGFRNNFSRIKTSLENAEGRIDTLESSISTEGGRIYVTATHFVAHQDVKIGDTLITVDNNDQLVISANGKSGTLVARPNVVSLIGAAGLTDSITNTTTGTFAVQSDADLVQIGATVVFPDITGTFTVTSVITASNYITVTPEFDDTPAPFTVGDTLLFTNPFFSSATQAGDLYVQGSIYATGNITAYYGSPSDQRLKENVRTIENSLDKIKQISGVLYDWNEEFLNKNPGTPRADTGVIAQAVQLVLPEVITTDANGYLGVRYEKLAGLIIEAIKELSVQVDEIKRKLP